MTDLRVTQESLDAWLSNNPELRSTQTAIEVWRSSSDVNSSSAFVSQVGVEIWRSTADASTLTDYSLTLDPGSFSLAGQSAGLGHTYSLTLEAGSFGLTGKAAGLSASRRLSLDSGAFTINGQSAGLGSDYALTCAPGSFALTGNAASLVKGGHTNYSLTCAAGSFALTGKDASLFTIDPFFPDVVLLVGADGANGSTAFVDESRFARPLTAVGNAQISSSNVSQGTGCILLDGSGDFVSTPNATEFGIGGIFTIEASVRPAETTDFTIISLWGSTVANSCWALGSFGGLLTWKFYDSGGVLRQITSAWTPTLGTYYDIAVSRDNAGKTRLRINGVVVASNTSFGAPRWVAGASLFIGRQSGSSLFDLNGRIDELRVTNAHDRYDTDATTPKPPKKFPRTGYTVVGAAGAFAFTGNPANLNVQRRLAANAGSFTLTGKNASLTYGILARGEFALTGNPAIFRRGYRLKCDPGAFQITAYPDLLAKGYRLGCTAGAFHLLGKIVTFKRTYRLVVSAGAFVLAGQPIGLRAARTLLLSGTSYSLSGADAALAFHRAPTFLIGKVEIYPALGGSGSIESAIDGASAIYPALDCAPKTNRWVA